MLEGIMQGLTTALSIQNLLMVVAGCLIGTLIGMLPGLGPMSIIAIMIPIAIKIGDPSAALILLAGVYYGAIFGGSTSSILINAPGVAGTVASAFDGYPMARQGKAGKALTIAAICSFAGGTVGAILLMFFAPALSSVALLFHSAEYFAMMVVGLSAIAAFAGTGKVVKALMMTVIGLILATVGESALFNAPRFTMGRHGPAIRVQLHYARHGLVRVARSPDAGPRPQTQHACRRWRRNQGSAHHHGRSEIHRSSRCPSIDPRIFDRRHAGRRRHHRIVPRLCSGTQHRQGRRTRRIRQRLHKGPRSTGNRQQCRLHRVLRPASYSGNSRFRHDRDPARCADCPQRQSRSAFDDRQSLGLLGRDHFYVYRQSGVACSQPAADPLHRQIVADPAQLPHSVHPVLHHDWSLYRSEQRYRVVDPGRLGRLRHDPAFRRLSSASPVDRLHSRRHAGRQFRPCRQSKRWHILHGRTANDLSVADPRRCSDRFCQPTADVGRRL